MADIKRLHYFDHQLLVEKDFTDEQTYHLDMRRRHNRTLHEFGAANGLNVRKTGEKKVTVEPGTAIDGIGREIILDAEFVVDLSASTKYPKNAEVHVVIAYDEEPSDQVSFAGAEGATRITEKWTIDAVTTPPATDGTVIRLATFKLDGNANVPGNVGDLLVEGRRSAGPLLAPETVGEAHLVDGSVTESKLADGAVTAAKIASGAVTPDNIGALSIKGGKIDGSLDVGEELTAKTIHVTAPRGVTALHVEGTAVFSGEKRGFTVDTFINASGKRLHMGDVVKLKGTKITRFTGTDDRIPVPEVTLADKERDPLVIGVVSGEAPPEPGANDTRVEPEDPTFIEKGGVLFVITLGTFRYCKVDTTEDPIHVGDPLSSSSNPGHAKKAKYFETGTIIGKALESLEKGKTGSIAVFVNIQ